MSSPPGWYRDPHDPSKARYWDGAAWTDQVQDLGLSAAEPAASQPTGELPTGAGGGGGPPLLPIGLGLLALLVIGVSAALLLTSLGDDGDSGGEVIAAGSATGEQSTPPAEPTTTQDESVLPEAESTPPVSDARPDTGSDAEATGPAEVIERHWQDRQTGNFDRAFQDLAPGHPAHGVGLARWRSDLQADGLTSVDVAAETRQVDGQTAIVDVVTLRTQARQSGCKDWSGHYRMQQVGGGWKIADARVEPASC